MMNKLRGFTRVHCLLLVWWLLVGISAFGQTTAFTYQGKLTEAGTPASGTYDMQFKLFDTVTVGTGTQQGTTLVNPTVQVAAGSFSVTLNFGAPVFDGTARFLEIGVRPAGSANPYTVLAPRQTLTSSPYAIQTLNAQQLGGLPASRYVAADGNGNVGIGTNAPLTKIDVRGSLTLDPGSNPTLFTSAASTEQNRYLHLINSPLAPSASGLKAGGILVSDAFDFANPGKTDLIVKGQMSIGSPTLLGRLHVSSPGSISDILLSTGSGTEGAARFRVQTDSGLIGQGGSLVIYDDVAGQYRFVINGSGNVGIGTTTPAAKLSVVGNVTQDLSSYGLPKAMVEVAENGSIIRCYNAITNSSSGTCGFNVVYLPQSLPAKYKINFGFDVRDRFFSVTAKPGFPNLDACFEVVAKINDNGGTGLSANEIYVYPTNSLGNSCFSPFFVIVY
jgi:hypothetical protein